MTMIKKALVLGAALTLAHPAFAAVTWELEIEFPGGYKKTLKADALKKVDLGRAYWSCELSGDRKLSSTSLSRVLTCRHKYHPEDVVSVLGFCRLAETNVAAVNLTDKTGSYSISISCNYK